MLSVGIQRLALCSDFLEGSDGLLRYGLPVGLPDRERGGREESANGKLVGNSPQQT